MDADDKENIEIGSGLGGDRSRVGKMEDDQNKRRETGNVNVIKTSSIPLPVDLSTDMKPVPQTIDLEEHRWVPDPLDSGEDDVFFGDVTNKEVKKAKKYESRRTAVYVPGFRMDRRLMRYTMGPQALKPLGENPAGGMENIEEERPTPNGQDLERTSNGNNSTPLRDNHHKSTEIISSQDEKLINQLQNIDLNGATSTTRDTENNVKVGTEQAEQANDFISNGANTSSNTTKGDSLEPKATTNINSPDNNEELTADNKNTTQKENSDSVPKVMKTETKDELSIESTGNEEPLVLFGKINKNNQLELDPWGNKPVPVDPAWYLQDCSDSEEDDLHEIVIRARLRSPLMSDSDDADSEDDSDDSDSDSDSGEDESGDETEESDSVKDSEKNSDGLEPDIHNLITEVINESIHDLTDEPNCPLLLSDDEHAGPIILGPEDYGEVEERKENKYREIEYKKEEEDVEKEVTEKDQPENTDENTHEAIPENEKADKNKNNSNSNDSHEQEKSVDVEEDGKESENDTVIIPAFGKEETKSENNSSEIVKKSDDQPINDTPTLVEETEEPSNAKDCEKAVNLPSTETAMGGGGGVGGSDILPNIGDEKAMAIDTIVARAADNEEIVPDLALPELDIEELIGLLETPSPPPITPSNDNHPGNNNDAFLENPLAQPRRNLGDNTMVVASTNRLGAALDGLGLFHILPEIQTKIDSTRTVASVTGPISSPGAPRSARKYRSIYATLPADESIEIETPEMNERVDEDFMTSFTTKLDLDTSPKEDTEMASGTNHSPASPQSINSQISLPKNSTSPVPNKSPNGLSKVTFQDNNPFSVVINKPQISPSSPGVQGSLGFGGSSGGVAIKKPVFPLSNDNIITVVSQNQPLDHLSGDSPHYKFGAPPVNKTSSSPLDQVQTSPHTSFSGVPKALNLRPFVTSGSPAASTSPTADLADSPSLVFMEQNFSPMLEVNFPPSPPIFVPSVQEQQQLPQSDPQKTQLISREKKRKQPCDEASKPAMAVTHAREVPKRTPHHHSSGLSSKHGKRAGAPRTPPKKVIGQPNVHKFHTHLSSSRSLFHKHCVHTSPRPKAKASAHHLNQRVPKSEPRLKSKPSTLTRTPTHLKTSAKATKTPASVPRVAHLSNNSNRAGRGNKTTPQLSFKTTPRATTNKTTPSSGLYPRPKTPGSFSSNSSSKQSTSNSSSKQSTSSQKLKALSHSQLLSQTQSKDSVKVSDYNDVFKVKTSFGSSSVTPKTLSTSTRCTLTPVRIATVDHTKKTPSSSEHKPRAVLGRRTPGSQPQDLDDFIKYEEMTALGSVEDLVSGAGGRAGGGGDAEVGNRDSKDVFTVDSSNVSSSRRKRPATRVPVVDSYVVFSPLASEAGAGGDAADVDPLETPHSIGKVPVYKDGTPRYPVNYEELFRHEEHNIYSEPPPPFQLFDYEDFGSSGDSRDGSRESSPRLSMEDVLERKRQQMMNLRAEKRKIQDIISKQGTPSVKTQRPNNALSSGSQSKPRFSNTQSLSLSDKELDAVTHLHTLCNSQRAAKVIHKGRALAIRQHPPSPHTPGRLSWNEDHLTVDTEAECEERRRSSLPNPTSSSTPPTPPRPILAKKDPNFVYPFDNEPVTPVVVFRSRNSDRHKPTRSPRID